IGLLQDSARAGPRLASECQEAVQRARGEHAVREIDLPQTADAVEGIEVGGGGTDPNRGKAPVSPATDAEREVVEPEAVRHGAPTRRAGPGAARRARCGTPR